MQSCNMVANCTETEAGACTTTGSWQPLSCRWRHVQAVAAAACAAITSIGSSEKSIQTKATVMPRLFESCAVCSCAWKQVAYMTLQLTSECQCGRRHTCCVMAKTPTARAADHRRSASITWPSAQPTANSIKVLYNELSRVAPGPAHAAHVM
jgi:hypothetical protein